MFKNAKKLHKTIYFVVLKFALANFFSNIPVSHNRIETHLYFKAPSLAGAIMSAPQE